MNTFGETQRLSKIHLIAAAIFVGVFFVFLIQGPARAEVPKDDMACRPEWDYSLRCEQKKAVVGANGPEIIIGGKDCACMISGETGKCSAANVCSLDQQPSGKETPVPATTCRRSEESGTAPVCPTGVEPPSSIPKATPLETGEQIEMNGLRCNQNGTVCWDPQNPSGGNSIPQDVYAAQPLNAQQTADASQEGGVLPQEIRPKWADMYESGFYTPEDTLLNSDDLKVHGYNNMTSPTFPGIGEIIERFTSSPQLRVEQDFASVNEMGSMWSDDITGTVNSQGDGAPLSAGNTGFLERYDGPYSPNVEDRRPNTTWKSLMYRLQTMWYSIFPPTPAR